MDRRNFLKYLAVTPAAASASKVLVGIPEAEPKIALLEAPEIFTAQTGTMEAPFIFSHIIWVNIDTSNNIYPQPIPGDLRFDFPLGRIHTSVSAEVYVEDANGDLIISDEESARQKYPPLGTEQDPEGFMFRLDIKPIQDWIYILDRYVYKVKHKEFVIAELQGFRVHPNP